VSKTEVGILPGNHQNEGYAVRAENGRLGRQQLPGAGVGASAALRSAHSLGASAASAACPQKDGHSQVAPQERFEECLRIANALYQQDPHWLTFFREIFGVDGVIGKLFPDAESRATFERSPEAAQVHQMLHQLRARAGAEEHFQEPLRMITVRLPASVHEFVRAQARAHGMSMNQYCIMKLLQITETAGSAAPSIQRSSTAAQRAAKPKPK